MENIRISIIIPAYNAEQYIGECLNSILSQTHQALEVIVVNDGSTDGTSALVEEYAARDGRVRLISQNNAGPHAARLAGIAAANGAYITFSDADDTVPSDAYERLLKNATTYNADISHCGVAFIFPDRTVLHCKTGEVILQSSTQGQIELLEGAFVEPSLCNKLYKAELFSEMLPDLDVRNNEDLLVNFVLFGRAEKIVYEGFNGYNYVQREFSQKDPERIAKLDRDVICVRDWIAAHCPDSVQPYANKARLAVRIVVIQGIISRDKHYLKNPQYQQLRQEIAQNQKLLDGLRLNHRVSAWLCMHIPGIHRFVYKTYFWMKGRGRT